VIARFEPATGAVSVLPAPSLPLPAVATSYTDPSPPNGSLSCYFLFPITPSGVGRSDGLCILPGLRTASGAPGRFAIELRQSPIARLSWTPPGGQDAYVLVVVPLAGGAPSTQVLPGTAVETSHDTGVSPTCYLLVAIGGGQPFGNTDFLCALPGLSALAAPTDLPGSMTDGDRLENSGLALRKQATPLP
jgi:hypothetical protein